MRVMNLNKLIFLQLRGPEGKKIPKAISDFGVDNSKYTIISLSLNIPVWLSYCKSKTH